ncbi:hypothetical protein [Erythrobacter sp. WG]|uniref:hypothetical protein n=1 Tax=Erythrobacter sp. WG TaxID=2985510 RepID=UPI00226DBBEC|nr:hypothetical protein [Erythrobacter sp. WG]MCX9146575.1 hypothetical protein [Erythrobacter sp. WG]
MASFIIHGQMPDRFRLHLAEAIRSLGYFRMDALDQLLEMYREQWPRGLSSTMFRSSDIGPLLSDKGAADPDHAQKATTNRAHFNLRREEFDLKEIHGATGLMFWAPRGCVCSQASERDGAKVNLSGKWSLPLPGCNREWCPCNWTWSFDFD